MECPERSEFFSLIELSHGTSIRLSDYIPHMSKLVFSLEFSAPIADGDSTCVTLFLCECGRFKGPFSWKNSRLEVSQNQDGRFSIRDDTVDFSVDFESGWFTIPSREKIEEFGKIFRMMYSGRRDLENEEMLEMNDELPARCVQLLPPDAYTMPPWIYGR